MSRSFTYTKEDLTKIFFSALEDFNDCLDSDICKDNLRIEFFNGNNAVSVYEQFCSDAFPEHLDEPYKAKGYFDSIAAQAFVGESCYGVLIREDVDFPPNEITLMLLHEISHLYCTQNEIPGGHFFDKYCMGSGVEDGIINAGYAIWREAIADIMADSVMSDVASISLPMVKNTVHDLYRQIDFKNPASKKAMSLLIAYIMLSAEVAGTTNWAIADTKIRRSIGFTDPVIYGILELVFKKLHTSPFWTITYDFIFELGELYLNLLATRFV